MKRNISVLQPERIPAIRRGKSLYLTEFVCPFSRLETLYFVCETESSNKVYKLRERSLVWKLSERY